MVGDRDRPEPFRLCVLDQRLRLDRAVVRVVRVHVEIDDDPVPVAEGIAVRVRGGCATGRRRPTVCEYTSSSRFASTVKSLLTAVARAFAPEPERRASSSTSRATDAAASSGCSASPAGSAIAQPLDAASSSSRALPPGAGTKMAASASVDRRASGFTSDLVRARSRTAAGIVGRRVSGAVRASTISHPASVGSSRSTARATAL